MRSTDFPSGLLSYLHCPKWQLVRTSSQPLLLPCALMRLRVSCQSAANAIGSSANTLLSNFFISMRRDPSGAAYTTSCLISGRIVMHIWMMHFLGRYSIVPGEGGGAKTWGANELSLVPRLSYFGRSVPQGTCPLASPSFLASLHSTLVVSSCKTADLEGLVARESEQDNVSPCVGLTVGSLVMPVL